MFGLTRRDMWVSVLATGALGAVLGVAWWWWAPRVVLDVFGDQAFPADFQPGGYMTDEGLAALLCIAGGVIVTIAFIALTRRRGVLATAPGVVAWVTLVGLIGAGAMWFVGTRLGAVDLPAEIAQVGDGGQVVTGLVLRMPGIIVLWPLTSGVLLALGSVIVWIRDGGKIPENSAR